MTKEYLAELQDYYYESALPVIICDEMQNILWKNDACSRDDIIGTPQFTSSHQVFGSRPVVSGIFTVEISNAIFTCNAILIPGKGVTVTLFRYDFDKMFLSISPIKQMMKNMMVRIRTSVSTIAVASDEIYKTLQTEIGCDRYTANQLNLIEGNLALLMREIVGPEQLINMSTAAEASTLNSISEIMALVTDCIYDLFEGDPMVVESDIEPGLMATVSKNALNVVLSSILEELLSLSKKTEKLTIRAYMDIDDKVVISLMSENFSGAANDIDTDYVDLSEYENLNYSMKHLKTSFLEVFNVKYTEIKGDGRLEIKLALPAEKSVRPIISMSGKYTFKNYRFNPLTSRLALIKKKIRYKSKGEQTK